MLAATLRQHLIEPARETCELALLAGGASEFESWMPGVERSTGKLRAASNRQSLCLQSAELAFARTSWFLLQDC